MKTRSFVLLVCIASALAALPARAESAASQDQRPTSSSPRLAADLAAVLREKPGIDAAAISEKGVPTVLRGRIGRVVRATRDRAPEAAAWRETLENVAPAFRVRADDLEADKTWADPEGLAHIRYRMRKHGLDVVGASLSLHADATGDVYAVFGNVRDEDSAARPTEATVSAKQAREFALDGNDDLKADEPRLVYLIASRDQELYLAWEVQLHGFDARGEVAELVFVSATTGKIVDRHSQICDSRFREVSKLCYGNPPDSSTAPGHQPLAGWPFALWQNELGQTAPPDPFNPGQTFYQTTSPSFPSSTTSSHWTALEKAYGYFWNAHQRDSYDNAGGHLISWLNILDGGNQNNASWNGFSKILGFGSGFKASIWEFRVFSGGQNVAQGKSASATSYEYAPSISVTQTPSNAVDGNLNTKWVANVSGAAAPINQQVFPQTLRVDLGSSYSLQTIEIVWAGVNGWRFRLEVSSDDVNWTVVQGTTSVTYDGVNWTAVPDTTTTTQQFHTSSTTFSQSGRRYARVVVVGTLYGPLATDPDVVTHELAHGVTQHTSGLIYAYEPGALNEAFSDITAAAGQWWNGGQPATPSDDTWKLGETCYTPDISGDGAVRYLNDPALAGQPDYYPDRYLGDSDSGGVHSNNGIANLAFYMLVHGGTHPRGKTTVNVPAIPMLDAQKIFYRGFTTYLGPGARFADARMATVTAAQADPLLAQHSAKVHLAWDAVGVPAVSENNYPVNMSTRANVGTGDSITIAGFYLGPSGSAKPMLLRGVGPTLTDHGVSGVMADPELRLFRHNGSTWDQIPVNGVHDDWGSQLSGFPSSSAVAQAAATFGAFALRSGSTDAAFLPTLSPGTYSLHLSGKTGGGQAMVEFYDAEQNPANANHLMNLSTRCRVTGSEPAFAGFYINGSTHKWMLIRAVGPTLGSYGVDGTLSNPRLKIVLPDQTVIYQNDNWYASDLNLVTVTAEVGAFPLLTASFDAAMLVLLPPGTYTAFVESVDGTTGICLVELYEVPGVH